MPPIPFVDSSTPTQTKAGRHCESDPLGITQGNHWCPTVNYLQNPNPIRNVVSLLDLKPWHAMFRKDVPTQALVEPFVVMICTDTDQAVQSSEEDDRPQRHLLGGYPSKT